MATSGFLLLCVVLAALWVDETGALLRWQGSYNGYEYHLTGSSSDDENTWYEARQACMDEGGDLATLESDGEDRYISNIYVSFYGNLWIGLNKLSGEWAWADGKTTAVDNWVSNQPQEGELCVYRSSRTSRSWYSENCGYGKGFLCKRPRGLSSRSPKTTPPTTTVGGFCPPGFVGANTDRCYKFYGPFTDRLDWDEAREKCKSLPHYGADLACVTDQKEAALLTMMASQYSPNDEFFIGIYRSYYYYSDWMWADNSPLSVTNWHDRYYTSDDGCGFISSGLTPAGSWDSDGTCSYSKEGYVCQVLKDADNFISTPAPTDSHTCGGNYVPYEESCYRLVTEPETWQAAAARCALDQAALLHVHSASENAFLVYQTIVNDMESAWTGLKYDQPSSQYRWNNGWYVNQVFWGADQPTHGKGGGCVAMEPADGGGWYDRDCSQPRPFICKTTTAPALTPPPPGEGRCVSKEWIPLGDRCVSACSRCDEYWTDQIVDCTNMHYSAQLASIHDAVSNDILYKELYSQYSYGDAWLGLYRSNQNARWRWLDGSPLQYDNFAPGEPDSDPSSGEDCVYMSLSSSSPGKWFSSSCNTWRGRLCSMEMLENPATPAPVNGTCPGGSSWSPYGAYCYLFRPDSFANWDQAQRHCVKEGGATADLAVVKTWAENDFIHYGMLEESHLPQLRNFWVGLTKTSTRDYEWVDGSNGTGSFLHWGKKQPTNDYKHHCVQVNIDTSLWHNELCSDIVGYVCQAPITPYVTAPAPTEEEGGGGGSGGLSSGAVAGVVIACLIAVVLLTLVALVVLAKTRGTPAVVFNRFRNPTTTTPAGFNGPGLSFGGADRGGDNA